MEKLKKRQNEIKEKEKAALLEQVMVSDKNKMDKTEEDINVKKNDIESFCNTHTKGRHDVRDRKLSGSIYTLSGSIFYLMFSGSIFFLWNPSREYIVLKKN